MRPYIVRFGGLAIVLVAIAVGVLIGRAIEAIAVGTVLFAVLTSVARLLAAGDHVPTRASDSHLS